FEGREEREFDLGRFDDRLERNAPALALRAEAGPESMMADQQPSCPKKQRPGGALTRRCLALNTPTGSVMRTSMAQDRPCDGRSQGRIHGRADLFSARGRYISRATTGNVRLKRV